MLKSFHSVKMQTNSQIYQLFHLCLSTREKSSRFETIHSWLRGKMSMTKGFA